MGARRRRPTLDQILAGAAAIACVIVSGVVWRTVSAHQSISPLPALYFVEVSVVSVSAWVAAYRSRQEPLQSVGAVPWAAAGVLVAFSVLGMFSVGLLYLSIAGLLLLAALFLDHRMGSRIGPHLAVFALAALWQGGLMLVLSKAVSRFHS